MELFQKMVEGQCLLLASTKIKKCNKIVDNYPLALGFVLDCFKSQKKCNKTADTYLSAMQLVSECYKTQDMTEETYYKAVSNDSFMLKYCLGRYKTQESVIKF